MPYKMTYYWNQSVMGVSETWIFSANTPSGAATQINGWLAARQLLMFDNQFSVGIRISQVNLNGPFVAPSTRKSYLGKPGASIYVPGGANPINLFTNGKNSSTPGANQPDTVRQCLMYKVQYNGSFETQRYLSGIPDGITYTEPQTINWGNQSLWLSNWNAFRTFVTANCQIQYQTMATALNRIAVNGLVNASTAPSYLGIQVAGGSLGTVVPGTKIHLRGFRPPKGTRNATINGVWTVNSYVAGTSGGLDTIYLNNSQALTPDMISLRGTPTAQLVTYQLSSIDALLSAAIVPHKRGRPTLAPRGRRLTRYTLDP